MKRDQMEGLCFLSLQNGWIWWVLTRDNLGSVVQASPSQFPLGCIRASHLYLTPNRINCLIHIKQGLGCFSGLAAEYVNKGSKGFHIRLTHKISWNFPTESLFFSPNTTWCWFFFLNGWTPPLQPQTQPSASHLRKPRVPNPSSQSS